jgi:hypothetical protein
MDFTALWGMACQNMRNCPVVYGVHTGAIIADKTSMLIA